MDILYILGCGSKWNNNELRFSLRSIEKNAKNIGRVYVVGTDPGFLTDEVTFIPCNDPFNFAHKNIAWKIDYAIDHSDIGEHFLLSSDDHFYMHEVDFDNYPLYCKGVMPNIIKEVNTYCTSMHDTFLLLKSYGLPTWMTNPHCNTHITREAWKETVKIRYDAMQQRFGGEVNCILGNWMIEHGMKPTPYNDIKLKSYGSDERIDQILKGGHCLSVYDEGLKDGICGYLARKFPNASKYEKPTSDNLQSFYPSGVKSNINRGIEIIRKSKKIKEEVL